MHNCSVDIAGMKVLIVDDVPANIDILRETLQGEGYSILMATSGEAAIKVANKNYPDLILLDVMMPGLDGFETCQHLKKDEKTRDIPVIFVTARNDNQDILRGFSVGGVDYISKPIQVEEVLVRVETHLKLKKALTEKDQLISQLQDTNELLENSARIDILTGLPNRKDMEEKLGYELTRLNNPNATFSICLAKLCGLNSINGSLGTYVGDQILISIGQLIREYLNEKNVVGRWDGNEFMIIFPETNLQEAQSMIDGLKLKIQKEPLSFDENLIEAPMRFSIGNITKNNDNLEMCLKQLVECLKNSQEDWGITLADR